MPVVALIHYHLNGGGVTRIIEQQSAALTALKIPHLIFCGANSSATHLPHYTIPELHFSDAYQPLTSAKIITEIEQKIIANFGKDEVIYHFHNHSIGLNPHMGDLVEHFAKTSKLILQIHDFVEDRREKNLTNISSLPQLYPNGEHIHYLTINSRDKDILHNAGANNVTLLPNSYINHPRQPVTPINYIFYPVQLLQRKNIGEILLISLALPQGYRIAIGLTPPDTIELAHYWQSLATELNLPVDFDVCDRLTPLPDASSDFPSWYEHASHIITTSTQEGFGMVFIEPIHFQKPLIGRNLPNITKDITQQGVCLDGLYNQLIVNTDQAQDFGSLTPQEQSLIIRDIVATKDTLDKITVSGNHFNTSLVDYLSSQLRKSDVQDITVIQPWSLDSLINNLKSVLTEVTSSHFSELNHLNTESIRTSFSDLSNP